MAPTISAIAVSVGVTAALLSLLHKPLNKNWDAAAPESVATAGTV